MYQGLAAFCERISRETGEDGAECYVRLRVGENRRTAQLIASRIPASGCDPVELANELQDRIDNSGIEAIWIEAMQKGLTNPTDSFRVPRREEDDKTEAPADRMALVVERMARSADERAAGAEYRLQMANESIMALMSDIWAERLKMKEMEMDSGGGMIEALKMAAPVLAIGATRLLNGSAASSAASSAAAEAAAADSDDEPNDMGSDVDRCIAFLNQATAEHPDLITPERVDAMTPMVTRALGFMND
jgi:hypothetical protein